MTYPAKRWREPTSMVPAGEHAIGALCRCRLTPIPRPGGALTPTVFAGGPLVAGAGLRLLPVRLAGTLAVELLERGERARTVHGGRAAVYQEGASYGALGSARGARRSCFGWLDRHVEPLAQLTDVRMSA